MAILSGTYHFEFGEDWTVLGEWFDDFSQTCVLALLIEGGYCAPTEKGTSSIEYAFDALCEELEIDEDVAWTDFIHWNSQFREE